MMTTTRGANWREPRTLLAFHGAVALAVCLSLGCTSNRFRVSNDPRVDRNAELAVIDSRTRQVPAVPGGLPAVPAIAAAENLTDYDVASNDDRIGGEPRVPAATYPPRVASPPLGEPDPDAALVRDNVGLNNRITEEAPPPGRRGSLVAPPVDGPQIVGRVVNAYGRPEPNASIQIFDLAQNRRLVAETASGPDGRFRALNLEPGRQYEIAAASLAGGMRSIGTLVAVPPEAAAVVRLEPENRRSNPSYGVLDGVLGSKALQSLTSRPKAEPAPTSDNVRISAPRLVAADRTDNAASNGELTNAVAEERSEPATLPSTTARTTSREAERPNTAESAYAPPKQGNLAAGRIAYPIIYKEGTPGTVDQVPGEIILIDFWGSWCKPCRESVPHLNDLHSKYSARGLHIIGAAAEHGSRGKQLQSLNQAASALKVRYTYVLCPGALGEPCPLRSAFGVTNFPTFVLIDRNGRVLFRGTGGNAETLGKLDRAIGSYLASVGR
jgi:thiol-disulfide isomerase/thioredoxin